MGFPVSERLFGTDGVRGIPGRHPMTPETIRTIGVIAARLLLARRRVSLNGSGPAILVARDTRGSGPALARSLAQGFAAAGCRARDLGVAPTPAVSYLLPRLGCVAGVTVSASHNPAEFNGIKFFTADGLKMGADLEDEIERLLPRTGPPPARAARLEDASAALERYVEFLRSTFPPHLDLDGLKIVLDCAHGAASAIAPALFEGLGARVIRIGCAPDGRNINKGCGALDPLAMRRAVLRERADCGISLDGDADRALLSDEKGRMVDGDVIIGLSALRLKRQGALRGGRVAVTVMSNLGLVTFLEGRGIAVERVPVGDRAVSEAIEGGGLSLGGEASGHVIFRDFSATGDGMLTALQTLAAWRETGRPLGRVIKLYRPFPQVMRNVSVSAKPPLARLSRLAAATRRYEGVLGARGRVLIRYSGTEPLLRVMVEGPSAGLVRRAAAELVRTFREESAEF